MKYISIHISLSYMKANSHAIACKGSFARTPWLYTYWWHTTHTRVYVHAFTHKWKPSAGLYVYPFSPPFPWGILGWGLEERAVGLANTCVHVWHVFCVSCVFTSIRVYIHAGGLGMPSWRRRLFNRQSTARSQLHADVGCIWGCGGGAGGCDDDVSQRAKGYFEDCELRHIYI